MNSVSKVLALFLVCVVAYSEASVLKTPKFWTHNVDLDKENGIKFSWKNSEPDADGQKWLFMEVTARATGYVGVGFSPHGGMAGGDMAIVYKDSNGIGQIKDMYGVANAAPLEDPKQDYHLLNFEENEGLTKFQFKRRWDTCDSNDFAITNDTMRLIWAYSNSKPAFKDGSFQPYHGPFSRGAKSVIVVDGGALPPFPDSRPDMYPGVEWWDIQMDKVPVTLKDTYYHCKVVKFTDLDRKNHLIGWKPIIEEGNRDIVHHIVVFECSVPEHEVPIFDGFYHNHTGGTCYTPNMPSEWGKNCVAFSLAWVVGSEGEMFPDHVGSPLGEMHGGATYFMVEMHYENPTGRRTHDSSGIRMFYTDKLRKYDGGTMLIGYRHSPFLLIPPKQENFVIHGLCGTECTSKAIPETGIRITNTLVHMHLAGKKIRLRHFRDGVELPMITEDNYYDFNYQQGRILKDEITIMPNDHLLAECEYGTADSSRYVIGGLATNQEMCQIFFFYYPRVNLSQCTSQYEFHDFFKGFGVDGVEGKVLDALHMPYEPHKLPLAEQEKDIGDDARELEAIEAGISFTSVFNHMNITRPLKYKGKIVGKLLEEINWTTEKAKQLEKFWKNGKHYQYCSKPGLKRVILQNHIIDYPKLNKVLEKKESAVCLRENYYLRSAGSRNVGVAGIMATLACLIAVTKILY